MFWLVIHEKNRNQRGDHVVFRFPGRSDDGSTSFSSVERFYNASCRDLRAKAAPGQTNHSAGPAGCPVGRGGAGVRGLNLNCGHFRPESAKTAYSHGGRMSPPFVGPPARDLFRRAAARGTHKTRKTRKTRGTLRFLGMQRNAHTFPKPP